MTRWRIGIGAGAVATLPLLMTLWTWTALTSVAPATQPGDLLDLMRPSSQAAGAVGWKLRQSQPVTLLLLGYGGRGHSGPYLTDSMMLAFIDPKRPGLSLISLPRDLVVQIPALPDGGYLVAKMNLAYEIGIDRRSFPSVRPQWQTSMGGGDLAAATVSHVIGRPVDGWLAVDFAAFRDVVDGLGKIQVDVPRRLDDPSFPAGETVAHQHIRFFPGRQWLNGEQALEYARSRMTTSDADRTARQRVLLQAIRQRAGDAMSAPRLLSIVIRLRDHLRTSLRPAEVRDLLSFLGHLDRAAIRSESIDSPALFERTATPDGNYLLLPRDPTLTVLHRAVASLLAG